MQIERLNENKIRITVSNFASYDFLRAIIGDTETIDLVFLLGPGKDTHSYELTAQDLITIQESDAFVYVGENVEKWSTKIIETLDMNNTKVLCISEDIDVEKKETEHLHSKENDVENHEGEHHHGLNAFDEHIWTSPENAIIMIKKLEKMLSEIDKENEFIYKENSQKYINEIENVDQKIQKIVNDKVRNRLVFGDKMPMQYFIDYYSLDVLAAFTGCSTETEPSASIIANLVDVVKNENIPVVLYIEMGNEKVANTIVREVGGECEAMQIQTLHNVSKEDFENGETWVTLMERNLEVLKKGLL